jgi:hypothetical protein
MRCAFAIIGKLATLASPKLTLHQESIAWCVDLITGGFFMTQQSEPVQENTPTTPLNTWANVDRFGYYLDGWADLIEGQGGSAGSVLEEVVAILRERYPEKEVIPLYGTVAGNRKQARPYAITSNPPGYTTTIYVGERGKDLFVSWRSFRAYVLNSLIWWVIGVSVFLALFVGVVVSSTAFGIISLLFILWASFELLTRYSRSQLGSPMAIFYVRASLFNQEDWLAMNMAVHKSMLQALDKEGIDLSTLRLKQQFNPGDPDQTI